MFADDTILVSLITNTDEASCRTVLSAVVWFSQNHLATDLWKNNQTLHPTFLLRIKTNHLKFLSSFLLLSGRALQRQFSPMNIRNMSFSLGQIWIFGVSKKTSLFSWQCWTFSFRASCGQSLYPSACKRTNQWIRILFLLHQINYAEAWKLVETVSIAALILFLREVTESRKIEQLRILMC